MHRVVTNRVLLSMKLKNEECRCVRMHSRLVRWREPITGYHSMDFQVYKKLLADNLGVDKERATILLKNNMNIIGISEENIVKNCRICQKENVDMQSDVHDLKFLELTDDDLEHRILLLKEMGAQYINTAMLKTCASRVHVVTFKAYTKISDEEHISEKLFSHLHQSPPEVPPLTSMNDYMTVKEYRKRCLTHWLKWRLEIPDTNHRLMDSIFGRLRYKSFSKLRRCFDALHDDLGMSVEAIREKKFLPYTASGDLPQIIADIPEICGVPTRDLLKKNISLLRAKYNNLLTVKKLLEDFGITSEQLLKTPKILLGNAGDLEVGLETITATPELKILIDHPSLLQILLIKDGVQRRIEYLRYLNVNTVTMTALGKSKADFDRYLRSGRHRCGELEIALMLKNHLGRNANDIQERIKRHPLWKHVDVVTIHNTLQYLKQSFNAEDIFRNVPLLLYARDKIEYSLSSLIEVNNRMDEANRFTPSQLLALCGYQIEREFHFTGDGVWDTNKIRKVTSPGELSEEPDGDERREYEEKYSLNDVNTSLFINTNKTERWS